MKDKVDTQLLIGIEFVRLTRMDRYLLNEYIAYLEKKIYPDMDLPEKGLKDDEIWRGNRRRSYRLHTGDIDLNIELDFRPTLLKVIKAKVVNISPAGCQLLLPSDESMDVGVRIPRVQLRTHDSIVACRGSVVYVSDNCAAKIDSV